MYRGAMRCLLSELLRQQRLSAVNELPTPDAKTKNLVEALEKLELNNVLIVDAASNELLERAARNLNHVESSECGRSSIRLT